jgi:hypothetical protein
MKTDYDEKVEDVIAMETQVILSDGQKYAGKYVAIAAIGARDVVASGDDFAEVHDNAKLKTCDPIVFYVPDKNTAQIY